jgi:sulfur carrier protein
MKVQLRNPRRDVDMPGPLRVDVILRRLDIERETVLVIIDGTLVPGDALVPDDATVEVRPVISGGMA